MNIRFLKHSLLYALLVPKQIREVSGVHKTYNVIYLLAFVLIEINDEENTYFYLYIKKWTIFSFFQISVKTKTIITRWLFIYITTLLGNRNNKLFFNTKILNSNGNNCKMTHNVLMQTDRDGQMIIGAYVYTIFGKITPKWELSIVFLLRHYFIGNSTITSPSRTDSNITPKAFVLSKVCGYQNT